MTRKIVFRSVADLETLPNGSKLKDAYGKVFTLGSYSGQRYAYFSKEDWITLKQVYFPVVLLTITKEVYYVG